MSFTSKNSHFLAFFRILPCLRGGPPMHQNTMKGDGFVVSKIFFVRVSGLVWWWYLTSNSAFFRILIYLGPSPFTHAFRFHGIDEVSWKICLRLPAALFVPVTATPKDALLIAASPPAFPKTLQAPEFIGRQAVFIPFFSDSPFRFSQFSRDFDSHLSTRFSEPADILGPWTSNERLRQKEVSRT